jgi:hypothetical protein
MQRLQRGRLRMRKRRYLKKHDQPNQQQDVPAQETAHRSRSNNRLLHFTTIMYALIIWVISQKLFVSEDHPFIAHVIEHAIGTLLASLILYYILRLPPH